MKRNARVWMLLAFTPLAMGLTGCGSQSVDSRDIEFNGGLAYQVNHQDPFTGIVTYVHDTPNFVGKLYGLAQIPGYNFAWAGNFADNINAEKNFTCSFHYVKGIMNGDAECKNDDGDETASFSMDEKSLFDGKATLYSPRDAKKKCAKLNFTHGVLDGRQQTYGDDGSTVIDDVNIANGIKDGREIVKDEAGDVISDGTWKEGKPSDGSFTDVKIDVGPGGTQNIKLSTIENYANGLQNGKASFYSANDDFKSPSENILSSGEFENGHRTGLWKENSPPPIMLQEINVDSRPVLWDFPPYRTGSMQQGNYARYVALRDCDSYQSSWSQGHLAGKVECFTKSGSPLVEFEIENGQLIGDVIFHDPTSGQVVTIHQKDGREVSTDTSMPTPTSAPQELQPTQAPSPQAMQQAAQQDMAGQAQSSTSKVTMNTYGNVVASFYPGKSPLDAIDDALVSIHSELTVMDMAPSGYPEYQVECESNGQCVGGTGTPMGAVADIAKEMFPVNPKDVGQGGITCGQYICNDGKGNVIGRASAAVQ